MAKTIKHLQQEAEAKDKYPDGKLDKDDKGVLALTVEIKDGLVQLGLVQLEFGKSVTWLGMTPDIAWDLGHSMMTAATKILEGKKAH